MAKKGRKVVKGTEEEYSRVAPTPPKDAGPPVESGAAGFLNFEYQGQSVVGTIVGQQGIPNKQSGEDVQRWVMLPSSGGETVILPDHYDLDQKLMKLNETTPAPFRVWVQYLGKRKANTLAGFVQVYDVRPMPWPLKEGGDGA